LVYLIKISFFIIAYSKMGIAATRERETLDADHREDMELKIRIQERFQSFKAERAHINAEIARCQILIRDLIGQQQHVASADHARALTSHRAALAESIEDLSRRIHILDEEEYRMIAMLHEVAMRLSSNSSRNTDSPSTDMDDLVDIK
jgi:hypothetical protein